MHCMLYGLVGAPTYLQLSSVLLYSYNKSIE